MRAKLFCIAAAALLVAGFGNVWAEEIAIDWTYSGSFVDSASDLNLDGTTGNEFHVWTKGGPGRAALNGVYEVVLLGPTQECPAPLIGYDLLHSTWVGRFDNGDLLFAQATESVGCFEPGNPFATGVVYYEIIGGTGKYQGATGSYTDQVTWVFLLQGADPLNPLPFGAVFGHAEGFLYTAGD